MLPVRATPRCQDVLGFTKMSPETSRCPTFLSRCSASPGSQGLERTRSRGLKSAAWVSPIRGFPRLSTQAWAMKRPFGSLATPIRKHEGSLVRRSRNCTVAAWVRHRAPGTRTLTCSTAQTSRSTSSGCRTKTASGHVGTPARTEQLATTGARAPGAPSTRPTPHAGGGIGPQWTVARTPIVSSWCS